MPAPPPPLTLQSRSPHCAPPPPPPKSDSLLTYVVWYALGGLFLILSRFFVDLVIIPGQELNMEIKVRPLRPHSAKPPPPRPQPFPLHPWPSLVLADPP